MNLEEWTVPSEYYLKEDFFIKKIISPVVTLAIMFSLTVPAMEFTSCRRLLSEYKFYVTLMVTRGCCI